MILREAVEKFYHDEVSFGVWMLSSIIENLKLFNFFSCIVVSVKVVVNQSIDYLCFPSVCGAQDGNPDRLHVILF